MHWIDRGPAPDQLGEIRSRLIRRWIRYYINRRGDKPSDTYWRQFRPDLEQVFHGLCAYCEEICRGEVEHFRPKSLFPRLVYEWSNWLFVCHDCNLAKKEKWPSSGYVNPCAISPRGRPERYFAFDALTGEILPSKCLNSDLQARVQQMIDDLELNGRHHLKKRVFRLWILWLLTQPTHPVVPDELKWLFADVGRSLEVLASRSTELSSVTRAWLSEQGRSTCD